jgi:hypothetical protein
MHSLCTSPFKCTVARKYRVQIPCLHKLVCCLSVDIIAQLVVPCISTNFLCYLGRKFGRQSHSVIIGKANVRFSAWHAMTQSVSRVTALASLNLGARWGHGINATPRPLCLRERAPVPIVWAPGPVWTGVEKRSLPLPGFRTPHRRTCSVSLYRQRYTSL